MILRPQLRFVEEVLDYKTFRCSKAKPHSKPNQEFNSLGFRAEARTKKEYKMDLPGRNVDFRVLLPPLHQQETPTRL
tara:strand:+ start:163 stop:393 length:231 start_codon:yes stop_codon:yes gene_type:complete